MTTAPLTKDPRRGSLLALIGGVLFAERVTERCAADAANAESQAHVRAVFHALSSHAGEAATALEKHWRRFSDLPTEAPATSSSSLPPTTVRSAELGKALSRSIDLMQLLESACSDEPLEVRQFCADWLAQRFALGWTLKEALNNRERQTFAVSAAIIDP